MSALSLAVLVVRSVLNWLHSAFTGYIDVEARHLFFYFFESRSNPEKDDVIFWTNGGPGCSSSTGLFMELGEPLHLLILQCVTDRVQARAESTMFTT